MKTLLCSLGLLAGLVSSATAQEGPLMQHGPLARPAWASSPRPAGRAEARPDTRSQPVAQPIYRPVSQYDRSVNVVDLAVGVVQTVQLVNFLKAQPEVLTTPRPVAPDELDYARPRHAAPRPRAAASQLAASFGLKAGLNVSTITGGGGQGYGYQYRAGFSGGLLADLPLSDHLSFHPELLYSQKGAKYSGADELGGVPVSINGNLRLHYLDLPLLLRLKSNGLFFEVGPQLGYLLGVKQEATVTVPGLPSFTDNDTDLTGHRRLDVGYVLGLGYQLPQGLEFGLRYNGGISDLQNPSDDPKLRNSVFQAQVGYAFGK